MDPQQETLRALGEERNRLLGMCVIDMDHVDRVEKIHAYLTIQIAEDRLVGAE